MASNARLLVEIAASIGTFREDLGRAAAIAESNAKRIEGAFGKLDDKLTSIGKNFILGLASAFSAAAITEFIRDTVAAAEELNNLAAATGSTIENLSRLANQARIAGTDFTKFQDLMLKLSANLALADDSTSNIGRAFAALGIRARDPAEAVKELAVQLNKYADGVGKAALVADVFGGGAGGKAAAVAFLSTLKEIAQAQDIAATTSTRQAQEAEELAKALRRISVESTTLKDAILSGIVPALLNLIERFRLVREAGESMFGAFLRAGTDVSTVKDQIGEAAEKLDLLRRKAAANNFLGLNVRKFLPDALLITDEDVRKQEAKLKALQKIYAQSLGDLSFLDKDRRPVLNYVPKNDTAAKQAMSEAQRYLENLERQLDRTKDLTVAEQVLSDIRSGRLKLTGGVTEAQLLNIARQIDAAKAEKDARAALARQLEEEARLRERISQAGTREQQAMLAETAKLAEANEALKEEIALVGADETKRLALAQARLDSAIALKEDTKFMYENAGGMEAQVSTLEDQIRILKERKSLLSQKGIAEALIEDAKKLKEFNDIFVNAFADSAVAIATHTKSIADAFRDMERQIVASISRIAAQKIAEALFGTAVGSTGATGTFSSFTSALAGLFGIGGANPGGFSGTGFASGTDFAPGGVSLVGERGPELVNLPRGAQVIPNEVLSSRRAARSTTIVQHINVLPGATTKSATQAAMLAGIQAQRALSRNA